MTIVRRLALCMACLAGLAPASVAALELGPIDVRSALYEPLDARIPVRGALGGDLEGLSVTLGSPAQFELAGVARLQHLGLLEFVVVDEDSSEGGGYIHVRTDEPIIESSLTFLIDVDWPRGRTVRGYKLRLASAAGGVTTTGPVRGAEPEVRSGETGDSPPPTTARSPGAAESEEYGPIRESETLWSIASRLRPDASVSTQRMMLAILAANPGAFASGNINGLIAGATLRIPSPQEIGPDDLNAAIAEVQRQHAQWLDRRTSPSDRASPAPADSGTAPGGRIEVVSPGAVTGVPEQRSDADVPTLRRELALATEEADASRRENDDLRLRLSDAENHIVELNRLVTLKDEEIAALQSELNEMARAMPAPTETDPIAGVDHQIIELNRLIELKDEEIAALRAELGTLSEATAETGAMPAGGAESESPSAAAPDGSTSAADATEAEPVPVPLSAATEPAASNETDSKSLPFGLGSLPVNPVFLVGGAGLLLLLLGVLALLRRRRGSTAAEEDVLEVADATSNEDGELLVELEAVAAELADEPGELPSRRPARSAHSGSAAGADDGVESDVRPSDDEVSERLVEERIAELWRDEDDRTLLRSFPDDAEFKDDSTENTFDIDALATEGAVPVAHEESPGDEFGAADAVNGHETDATRSDSPAIVGETGGETVGGADSLTGHHVPGTTGPGETGPAPAAVGHPSGRVSAVPDDARQDAMPVAHTRPVSAGTESGPRGRLHEGAGAGAAHGDGGDLERESNDTGGQGPPALRLPGEPAAGGGAGELPLEDVGEDEVQTKIDLAQVYMEMGDAESARGFLEAVLADGDAEQRDTARQMLSKLA